MSSPSKAMDIGILGARGYPLVYSGYETLVSNLAPALAGRGHDVTVYCHRRNFDARPKAHSGVCLRYVRGLGGKNVVQLSHSAVATACALYRRHDVVLFLNVANAPFAALLSALGIPTVVNVDGVEWERPKWSPLGRRYFRWAAGVAARRATTLVTDAFEMQALYRRVFGRASDMVAYGAPVGIEPDWGTLSGLGLERGEYFIVMGRLIPDNNSDLIAAEFLRSGSSKKLVVLGDVPYRNDPFAERIRANFRSSDMLFTGYISDERAVQALLEGSAGYIHGHEFGGTNPSLVWAMSAGCTILALDTPFSREVLDDCSCGGLFTKDPMSLARLVREVEQGGTVWTEGARAARERAARVYAWETIVSEYERTLSQAANGD